MQQFSSHSTNFDEFWYCSIFRKFIDKIQISLKWDKNDRYFTRRSIHIFDHILLVILRMRNVSDAGCRENQYTQFMINTFVFENRAVDVIIWKNSVEPGTPRTIICRIHIACWIPRATNTHSDYVILIDFPLQQYLHERASMLHYTYIAYLVTSIYWLSKFLRFSG